MKKSLCWLALTALALIVPRSGAIPLRVETERVPIERLLTNLQNQLRAKTNDFELNYAVGRLHSFAYALQSGDVLFEAEKKSGQPFYGYFQGRVLPPREVKLPKSPEDAAAATNHLKQAIAFYRRAVALKADHLPAQLGLGWCLDRAGDKPAAVAAYRKALDMAWKQERNQTGFMYSMTSEVADYLLPLLNPKWDATEIAKVKGYKEEINKKRRIVTPLLVPLGRETSLAQLVNPDAGVAFDLDGSGLPRRWGWITPEAGWLVYDRGGHDPISSGLQLVGGVTFWIFWQNGYHALKSLDDDGDDLLRGDELNGLAIWRDANSNGLAEQGEVKPVREWGITALSCRHETDPTGIPFSPQGAAFADGTTRPTYDWIVRSVER